MDRRGVVLVTGGSGFIAGWCVIGLLQQGYEVRATVRDLGREAAVRAALGEAPQAQERLTFYPADLSAGAGWDEAASGCDYVLHVASPMAVEAPADPDDLIIPAREGVRRVLTAAMKASVRRVVLTSSVAAIRIDPAIGASISDEKVWTDHTDPAFNAYIQSKTLAERLAWELVAANGGRTTLAVVNPTLAVGPVLGKQVSDSVNAIAQLLSRPPTGLLRLGYNIVDVRDVADLHIRAMTAPQAAGERFIAAGEFAWMADIATLLRERLELPDAADLPAVTPNPDRRRDYTAAKAQALLGWRARPLEDTVLDCARSLIAANLA